MKNFNYYTTTTHSCFLVENELLIFDKNQKKLYGLDQISTFIWLSAQEGLNPEKISKHLTKKLGVPAEKARVDVRMVLNMMAFNIHPSEGQAPQRDKTHTTDVFLRTQKPSSKNSSIEHEYYKIANTLFEIDYPDKRTKDYVHPVFSHFNTEKSKSLKKVKIVNTEGGYLILEDGKPIRVCDTFENLGPILNHELIRMAYHATDFLVAIHAAVVSNGSFCMIFPGISGSGKTTLTAGLIRSGLKYFSDEVTVISKNNHLVTPLPVSLNTKKGSWPILKNMYPNILNSLVYHRLDGQCVRYLTPPRESLEVNMGRQQLKANFIFFTKFTPNDQSKIASISPVQALNKLDQAGYHVNGGLTEDSVCDLVVWISNIKCYDFTFSSLEEAISLIKERISHKGQGK